MATGGEGVSFMGEALKLAEEALAVGEVPVGCVLVHGGVIVGRFRISFAKRLFLLFGGLS